MSYTIHVRWVIILFGLTFIAFHTTRNMPMFNPSGDCNCSVERRTSDNPSSHNYPDSRDHLLFHLDTSTFLEGQQMIPLEGGRQVPLDDILYGYDVLFETQRLFARTRWLGTVSSQDPIDAWVIQEVLIDIQPDIIIELGTYKGGGAVFYASIMKFYADEKPNAKIITVDPSPAIDISKVGMKIWNEKVVQIQGMPTDPVILKTINSFVEEARSENPDIVVMVIEDSIHYYQVVMDNIQTYWKFVTAGSYLLVQDTKLKRIGDAGITPGYAEGNNPQRAVLDFMRDYEAYFEVDRTREYLYYTQHPGGWLKRNDQAAADVV